MEITLNKNGLFTSEYDDNLKINKLTPIENLRYHYNDILVLSPGLTYGEVMSVLESHKDILETDFIADTRGWPLQPYFDWIKEEKTEDLDFKHIDFEWINDCHSYMDRKRGVKETNLWTYLSMGAKGNDGINYSLSFTSMNNLKDVPVVLTKECDLSIFDSEKGEMVNLLKYTHETKLREFIAALLSEITFYGDPENIKKQKEELVERSDELENLTPEELVEATTPWEVVQLGWLEDELKEALTEENYEWAGRVRDEISKVQKEYDEKYKLKE